MKFGFRLEGDRPSLLVPAVIGSGTQDRVEDVDAKIDTGADMSVIPAAVRKSLNLMRSGMVVCRGARGERWTDVPTFIARIRVAGGSWIELDVVESTNSYMLIGMDVLRRYIMTLNGPGGFFELSD